MIKNKPSSPSLPPWKSFSAIFQKHQFLRFWLKTALSSHSWLRIVQVLGTKNTWRQLKTLQDYLFRTAQWVNWKILITPALRIMIKAIRSFLSNFGRTSYYWSKWAKSKPFTYDYLENKVQDNCLNRRTPSSWSWNPICVLVKDKRVSFVPRKLVITDE